MYILKRIVAGIMCMGLTASMLCGCGEEKQVVKIGVCQLVEHTALDAATQGFVDEVKKQMGDSVQIVENTANGTVDGCGEIVKYYVDEKVDLIMTNATPAMISASNATGRIPIVATSITDYGTALNIRNWTGMTGINITGTSDLAPVGELENVILEIVPDVKRIGIIYCSYESNSLFQVSSMEKELKDDNISYQLYPVDDSAGVASVAQKAARECDAIYIPTDNLMASAAEKLNNIFVSEGVPMFAGEEGLCSAGVATLSIDYYSIGQEAGKMACQILNEGTNPANMEIRYAKEYTKKYNKVNAEKMGLKIPDDYKVIE